MKNEEFQNFVEETIENVIQFAEKQTGKDLPRKIKFSWFFQKEQPISENISNHITEKVFIDENNIFPCVDIGVGDILEDGSLLIIASIAGYAPRPWGKNWSGKDGPFIYIIGKPFLKKIKNTSEKK